MSDKNSFLPATQHSFLAALPETTENQIITGFDSFLPSQFCTPSFLGCKLCIGANVVGGFVTLTIQASTPFGGVTKSFKITNNISFTWAPFGLFKVEVKIANFKKTGSTFSFSLSVSVCIKVPFLGWKCATYSHTFSIPTILPQAHQSFLSAKADDDDDSQANNFAAMLLVSGLLEEKGGCNCG